MSGGVNNLAHETALVNRAVLAGFGEIRVD